MKITTKLVLLGLVGITAAPFILKKPDGTPWLSLADITRQTDQGIKEVQSVLPSKQTTQMFKWQDKEGRWHFSDQPSDQYQSREVTLDAAYNQMKHIELPDGFGGQNNKTEEQQGSQDGSSVPLTTAPLEKVPDMLKEIEKVQDRMEERQKILNGL